MAKGKKGVHITAKNARKHIPDFRWPAPVQGVVMTELKEYTSVRELGSICHLPPTPPSSAGTYHYDEEGNAELRPWAAGEYEKALARYKEEQADYSRTHGRVLFPGRSSSTAVFWGADKNLYTFDGDIVHGLWTFRQVTVTEK